MFTSEAFYRRMFFVAAAWNVLGGVLILLLTDWVFSTEGLRPPSPPLYYQAWVALFMTFGLGYYFVSREPDRNRPVVVLGIVGKLAFAAVFLYHFFAAPGQVPRLFLIPVVGDLAFVVLFGLFLNFSRKAGTA
jgi:hypothetical protein